MKLSIIIPVYNEGALVAEVMRQVALAPLPANLTCEIIVVDDGSNPSTQTALAGLRSDFQFTLVRLASNQGKGKALREGIAKSSGDVILFQDCDLEYDPRDYVALLEPIVAGRADIVYGSRFADHSRKPAITPLFLVANKALTAISNVCSGLQLTDMETGYKAFRAALLQGSNLRENGFGIEPEITAKLAKLVKRRGARIVEVPIAYRARSYEEGKKVKFRDGFRALWCIVKYNVGDRW